MLAKTLANFKINKYLNAGIADKILIKITINDPGEIRTHDPRFRRPLLYPAELPDHCSHKNINYYREKFC